MSGFRHVSLSLSDDLLLALGRVARRAGLGPSDFVAELMAAAVGAGDAARLPATAAIRLAGHQATDWVDLQRRLRALGFVLRLSADERLMLCLWPEDRPLMPAAAAGLVFADLAVRFRAGFPGHFPAGGQGTPTRGPPPRAA